MARTLLPEGMNLLAAKFDVVEGGLAVTPEELQALVPGAVALVADPTVSVDGGLLDRCGGSLKVVSNFAVGYDNIDLDACRQRGVAVTNTPDVLTEATAELALLLSLAASRFASDAERDLRSGRWTGWDPGAYLGLELKGATVGVVGLGRIGYRYAEMVSSLGAKVLFCATSRKLEAEASLGASQVELEELLARAELVSLHAPGGPETKGMIGSKELDLIGPSGVLVNTSRGSLVDTDALVAAIGEGRLGAVGLDVYEDEPEVPAALLEAPRCVLLPHIGSATHRSRDAMAKTAAANAIAVVEGADPISRVD